VPDPDQRPDALLADRDRLQVEIASLRTELDRATARLESLHRSGPEPRGFVAGVLAGLLVVVAGGALFFYAVAIAVTRSTG
jgi:hypothetical protein